MKLYLAGGAVRDILLGRPVTDRDYLVMEATRHEFAKAFPGAYEVGKTFPVFLYDRQEFSFPRAQSVPEELESRDLTVNAMLLDENGELYCHPNSLDDIHQRILRPASRQSFIDDPLRVFRAARFWAKMPDFIPHESLLETMRTIAAQNLLAPLPSDRIGQEVFKALQTPAPGNFLRLLAQTDCLSPWLDEFSGGLDIPAGPSPYHDTNVIEHTCRVMDAIAGDAVAVWMGLCHDLGKTKTPCIEWPTHHGHDKRGSSMAEDLSRRLRLSNTLTSAGAKAAQLHMIAARYDELRPGTTVDLLMSLHYAKVVAPLFKLVKADQDKDFASRAQRDLNSILSVRLQPKEMNKGAESGKRLRELRAQALQKKRKNN